MAAGVGRRLEGASSGLPKALLRIGGKTLLERHFEALLHCGVEELVIGTGFAAEAIEDVVAKAPASLSVTTRYNPDYRQGSILTLWHLREDLEHATTSLIMDADVLYDFRILERLVRSSHANCLLLDRDLEPGDEPVKICVRDGVIVDFHKIVGDDHDFHGESVGFFKFSRDILVRLLQKTQIYVEAGRVSEWYEGAIRDVLIEDRGKSFGFEDITGLPWLEIDFPEDVQKATDTVLPDIKEPRP